MEFHGLRNNVAASLFSNCKIQNPGNQPSLSLIWFHIERTSVSVLPILVEITRQENLDFSSDFKVRSFCFSSIVQVVVGLGDLDTDLVVVRRRFAGALEVALAFCFLFCGVIVVVESFEGSGRASGGGAAMCW